VKKYRNYKIVFYKCKSLSKKNFIIYNIFITYFSSRKYKIGYVLKNNSNKNVYVHINYLNITKIINIIGSDFIINNKLFFKILNLFFFKKNKKNNEL